MVVAGDRDLSFGLALVDVLHRDGDSSGKAVRGGSDGHHHALFKPCGSSRDELRFGGEVFAEDDLGRLDAPRKAGSGSGRRGDELAQGRGSPAHVDVASLEDAADLSGNRDIGLTDAGRPDNRDAVQRTGCEIGSGVNRHHRVVATGTDHGATGGETHWWIEEAQFDRACVRGSHRRDSRQYRTADRDVEGVERRGQ